MMTTMITKLAFLFCLFLGSNTFAEELPSLEICIEQDCSELFNISPMFDLSTEYLTDNRDYDCIDCGAPNDQTQIGESGSSLTREVIELAQVGVLSEVIARSYSQSDKQMHARAGAYVGYFSKKACEYGPELLELKLRIGSTGQFFCALAGAAIAGVLKEAYDSTDRQNRTVDSRDAVATGVGGLANIPLYRIEF